MEQIVSKKPKDKHNITQQKIHKSNVTNNETIKKVHLTDPSLLKSSSYHFLHEEKLQHCPAIGDSTILRKKKQANKRIQGAKAVHGIQLPLWLVTARSKMTHVESRFVIQKTILKRGQSDQVWTWVRLEVRRGLAFVS